MSSVVVVALPDENEPVWALSSEKKPHLTLLYMTGPLMNLENTIQFIQHAAETSLSPFGLSVDRRGTLGEDDADVLFFSQEFGVDKLRDFRAHLLTNEDIAKTYVKAEQFPGWIPHLTMGYPDAPAKKNAEDERYGLNWINFDRIAVWTSDFDGPEFRLQGQDGSFPGIVDVAWSDDDLTAENWSEPHGVHIMQFGTRGMRWGVRRPVGPNGLVKGTVAEAVKKNSSPDVQKALDGVSAGKGRKVSADHKAMQKNLDKKVENLSTKEIQDITKRIEAVSKLKATTDAQKAAKQSKIKKIANWALNSAVTGAKREGDKYIQELVGKQLKGVLPDIDGLVGGKKKPAATKTKDDNKSENKVTDPPSSTSTSTPKSKDDAVKNLADAILGLDGVPSITTLPKKGG